MRKNLSLITLVCLSAFSMYGQNKSYIDSLNTFQQKYVKEHGVVKGKDKSLLHFFPVHEKYKAVARFEKIYTASWFDMETSGKEKKAHRVYGILYFTINDTALKLYVYQSQQLMGIKEYANYLFAPFTDKTSGEESYENGRYIDMTVEDLAGGSYSIDFNKAYNPYCAYVSNVYNCPVPPKENDLNIFIRSGEMKYGKTH
jgi:uncharacterized protein